MKHKMQRKQSMLAAVIAGPRGAVLSAKNSISASGELLLYGVIGDWWDGLDSASIVHQLESLPGDEIVVRIQSPGGSVIEGLALYNRLKQSPKRVIVYIDGIAASMGCAVAMAGDVVYIPSNALMMMHKPSLDACGVNADELRDIADQLDTLEESYCQLHADKTGKSLDDIKALISDGKDHLFRGQEAINYGLADELTDGVQLDAVACAKFSSLALPATVSASLFKKPVAAATSQTEDVLMKFKIKAKKGGWHLVPVIQAALEGTYDTVEDAVTALSDSVTVDDLNAVLTGTVEVELTVLEQLATALGIDVEEVEPVEDPEVDPPEPSTDGGDEGAVARERGRIRSVRAIAAQASIDEKTLNRWIDSGTSPAKARAEALGVVAKRDQQSPIGNRVRGVATGAQGARAAMANALLHRLNPGVYKINDASAEFRGETLMGVVRAMLEYSGENVRGKTHSELAAMAMHATSDFPLILQDVASKVLRAAYELAPITYKTIAVQSNARDFRAKHSVQIGGGSELKKVNEAGEFESGTVTEGGESYKVDTYGRIFNFSRQLLINDDLGALDRFMRSVGGSAGRLENKLVWGLVAANPNLSDNQPVYRAQRGNQINGTAINDATMSAARKALRQMKGLDGELLSLASRYLVVNSERETEAQKMLETIISTETQNVNVFSKSVDLIVEPLLDTLANNPFFFFADPQAAPVLEYAYLEGEEGPYIESQWGFEVDGVALKVRHDFGAGFVDYRGTVKVTGTGG